MIRSALLLLLCLGLTGVVAGAPAQADPAKIDLDAGASEALARLEQAHARLAAARQRATKAELAYRNWRQRQYPRGKARGAVVAERDASRVELQEAEAALPRAYEEARRAGVPPGALRRFEP